MSMYTQAFYENLQYGARCSAEEIVPIILNLFPIKSVVDVGCGTGVWLSVFRKHGIEDILGIDGEYVDPEQLEIPRENFLSHDLSKPLRIERQFDLVTSLEVAEHLPEECAEGFVNSLTQLGSVILFSAAIPFQGGTEHVNEQWPDYWSALFSEKGYVAIDCIRPKVWQSANVEYWYIQNSIIFIKQSCLDLETYRNLKEEQQKSIPSQLSVVHPKKYLDLAAKCQEETRVAQWYISEVQRLEIETDPKNISLKRVIKLIAALPIIIAYTLKRKFSKNR